MKCWIVQQLSVQALIVPIWNLSGLGEYHNCVVLHSEPHEYILFYSQCKWTEKNITESYQAKATNMREDYGKREATSARNIPMQHTSLRFTYLKTNSNMKCKQLRAHTNISLWGNDRQRSLLEFGNFVSSCVILEFANLAVSTVAAGYHSSS